MVNKTLRKMWNCFIFTRHVMAWYNVALCFTKHNELIALHNSVYLFVNVNFEYLILSLRIITSLSLYLYRYTVISK